jgi:hypothetical protein
MSSFFQTLKEAFTGTPEQIAARKAANNRARRKVMGQNEQNTLPNSSKFGPNFGTPATRKSRKARKTRKSLRKRNLRK